MPDDEQHTATRTLIKKALTILKDQEESGTRTINGAIYMGEFPPLPDIPEEHHGKACSLMFLGAWGDDEAAQSLMSEFVDREVVFGKAPAPMPFGVLHSLLAGMFLNFPPFAPYWKGAMLNEIPTDKSVDDFCETWSNERKPYMGASLVGLELGIGKQGREHAERDQRGVEGPLRAAQAPP